MCARSITPGWWGVHRVWERIQTAHIHIVGVFDAAIAFHTGASVAIFGDSEHAYHRILKLAPTIANLAGEERIGTPHIAEAIQYRPRRPGYIGWLLTINWGCSGTINGMRIFAVVLHAVGLRSRSKPG